MCWVGKGIVFDTGGLSIKSVSSNRSINGGRWIPMSVVGGRCAHLKHLRRYSQVCVYLNIIHPTKSASMCTMKSDMGGAAAVLAAFETVV